MSTPRSPLQILAELLFSTFQMPHSGSLLTDLSLGATQLFVVFTPEMESMPIQVWTLKTASSCSSDWTAAKLSLERFVNFSVSGQCEVYTTAPDFNSASQTIWSDSGNLIAVQVIDRLSDKKNTKQDHSSTRGSTDGDKSLNSDSFVVELLGFRPLWLSSAESSDTSDYEEPEDSPEEFEIIRYEQLCSKLAKHPLFLGRDADLADFIFQ